MKVKCDHAGTCRRGCGGKYDAKHYEPHEIEEYQGGVTCANDTDVCFKFEGKNRMVKCIPVSGKEEVK